MNKPPLSRNILIFTLLLSVFIVLGAFVMNIGKTETKIVYCDVGQGDGTYIRVKNKIDIIIDAGPGKKILNCLGKHMPFYDRQIEVAIITHPQKDHYGGFLEIVDRYKVKLLIQSPIESSNKSFGKLLDKIKNKKITVSSLYKDEVLILPGVELIFYWPPKNLLKETTDPNDLSLIFSYVEDEFRALFTGDASPYVLSKLSKQPNMHFDIMKVPHHGSANGLTKDFLELADPVLSVISVGTKNAYGHPSKEIIDMLKASDKNYLRTDREGDIVIEIKNSKFKVFK